MYKRDVIAFFGGPTKTALALGVTRSAVHQWQDIVPARIAVRAEVKSGGALRINPIDYSKRSGEQIADRSG